MTYNKGIQDALDVIMHNYPLTAHNVPASKIFETMINELNKLQAMTIRKEHLEDIRDGLESAKAIIISTDAMQIPTADDGAKLDCYNNMTDAIHIVHQLLNELNGKP